MQLKDLKKLKVSDWLVFDEPGKQIVQGKVAERGYAALRVDWDDGQKSTFQFNDSNDPRVQFLKTVNFEEIT